MRNYINYLPEKITVLYGDKARMRDLDELRLCTTVYKYKQVYTCLLTRETLKSDFHMSDQDIAFVEAVLLGTYPSLAAFHAEIIALDKRLLNHKCWYESEELYLAYWPKSFLRRAILYLRSYL
jgi:hypothetical protein